MLESLVKSIENTFTQFTLGRLLYIIFVIVFLGGSVYLYNDSTGYTLYGKIDNKISALERLHNLEKNGIKESEDLLPLYNDVINDLKNTDNTISFISQYRNEIAKVTSATVLMLFFVIYGVVGMLKGTEGSSATFAGALIFTIILAVPSWFVPVISGSIWLTSGILLVLQTAILVFITKKYGD